MSDERRDDEILGRALSRAIETLDVNETPYERSRIASAPARRGFSLWQFGAAAAAIVLALAIGTWIARPPEDRGPVAASPTPLGSSSAAATPSPAVVTQAQDSIWVYFARDGLPPTGAFVRGSFLNNSPESRIASRMTALGAAVASNQVPAGATSALKATGSIAVRVQGDLATVEFNTPTWDARGSAQSQALLQQLVYTITEEPGIRRALITEKGKPNAVIDQLVVDKPLTREDVFGYGSVGPSGAANSVTSGGGTSTAGASLTTSYSVDSVAPGLARFVVTITGLQGAVAQMPFFNAYLDRTGRADLGKAVLYLQVGAEPNPMPSPAVVNRSPLRAVEAGYGFGSPSTSGGTVFALGLDDARPWRVFTLANPTRIVVDIGGAPQATSDRIAVYRPIPSTTIDSRISRTFTVSGAARVFEANVSWRLKDASGKIAADGHFLASLGSSALWGTFDAPITIPTALQGTGPVTLELYEASPKDGSEQGLVAIPLMIR